MNRRSCRRLRRWYSSLCESTSSLGSLEADLAHLDHQNPYQVRATYTSLLKLCGNTSALPQGRRVHEHIVSSELARDGFLGDMLVHMYGKCGSFDEAISVFNALQQKTVVSYNVLIGAYAKSRHGRKAIEVFQQMEFEDVKPDAVTLLSVIGACSSLRDLEQGRKIHARLRTGEYPTGIAVETALVKMYARCGKLQEARAVFDMIRSKDVICWNSMIAAYAQHKQNEVAWALYEEMESQGVKANDTTFAGILGACHSLEEGKKIHARLMVRGFQDSTVVQNALVSMYARCHQLDVARILFDKTKSKSVVSWNAMIAAYAQQGHPEQALELFNRMDLPPNEVTFASALSACSLLDRGSRLSPAFEWGRKIHNRIKGTAMESNITVATAIVTLYAKCNQVELARQLFDGMKQRNVVSWNAMLGGYVHNCRVKDALALYDKMVAANVEPDKVTMVIALNICGSLRLLELGRDIEKLCISHGFDADLRVQNALISMYGKCNELRAAREVFGKIKTHDVVSWTTLIAGHTLHGRDLEAIQLFKQMEMEGVEADDMTLTSVLKACASCGDIELGQELHIGLRDAPPSDAVVAALVNMYVKCGRLDIAREVFCGCKRKTLVIWNAMLTAYVQEGYSQAAMEIFDKMDAEGLAPDDATFSTILRACSNLKALEKGEEVHVQVVSSGTKSAVVLNAVICMYASCGRMRCAKRVFNVMENKDVVTWTSLISAYVQVGFPKKALSLYKKMLLEGVQPTEITMLGVIAACSALGSLWEGILVHASSHANFFSIDAVQAALITMYIKCRRLDIASRVFHEARKSESNVNSWNAMLAALGQLSYPDEAIKLYWNMSLEGLKPNEGTFAGVLGACSYAGAFYEGHKVHAQIRASRFYDNRNLKTALVHFYAKCNQLDAAWHIFQEIEELDIVAWNSMLAAYAQNSCGWHALDLYNKMIAEDVEPDEYSVTIILSVCANLRRLEEGERVYKRFAQRNSELGIAVECALFNLYAKCGKLDVAMKLFEDMKLRNPVCWHGIISAFAHHGYGQKTLWYYRRFKLEGYQALEPTFVCVLLASGHAGLVDEGRWYFHSMLEEGLAPGFDHYVCLVNMFARAGRLADAEDLLDNMPFHPNGASWTTLLGACKTHGDLNRARRAADQASELDLVDSAPYVLLSNIYAAAGCFPHLKKKKSAG